MTRPDETVTGNQPRADSIAARKARNVWLAVALIAFVIIIMTVTMIRVRQTRLSGDSQFYFSGALQKTLNEQKQRKRAAATPPVKHQSDGKPQEPRPSDDREGKQ